MVKLEPGKVYHYQYESRELEIAYILCEDIVDDVQVLRAYKHNRADPRDDNREYSLAVSKGFNDPYMKVEEVPYYRWALCVMKGEYTETP